ncbi:Zuotin [Dispira simplex]|nr:Zuotin [Dispira simplex]
MATFSQRGSVVVWTTGSTVSTAYIQLPILQPQKGSLLNQRDAPLYPPKETSLGANSSENAGKTSRVHVQLIKFAKQTIVQVGQRMQAFLQFRRAIPQTLTCRGHLALAEQQDKIRVAAGASIVAHGGEYDQDEEMLDMDPKDWKDQDHYAALKIVQPPPAKLKGAFFDMYDKVFEREAWFSKEQSLPMLGDMDTPRAQMETFYEFWYGINSWRTFEYWNRAERVRRKNGDDAHLRQLVDQVVKVDPRMIEFHHEDREVRMVRKNKGKAKNAKAAPLIKETQETKIKADEEAKELAQQKEGEGKAARQQEKKSKKEMRGVLRTHKTAIKELASANNYFVNHTTCVSVTLMEARLNKLDKLFCQTQDPRSHGRIGRQIGDPRCQGRSAAPSV